MSLRGFLILSLLLHLLLIHALPLKWEGERAREWEEPVLLLYPLSIKSEPDAHPRMAKEEVVAEATAPIPVPVMKLAIPYHMGPPAPDRPREEEKLMPPPPAKEVVQSPEPHAPSPTRGDAGPAIEEKIFKAPSEPPSVGMAHPAPTPSTSSGEDAPPHPPAQHEEIGRIMEKEESGPPVLPKMEQAGPPPITTEVKEGKSGIVVVAPTTPSKEEAKIREGAPDRDRDPEISSPASLPSYGGSWQTLPHGREQAGPPDMEIEENRTPARLPRYIEGETGGEGVVAPTPHRDPGPEISGLLKAIRDRIDKVKVYPRMARMMGLQGKVTVRFTIRPDGNVERIEVLESSGSRLLDDAAKKSVLRAVPFPLVEGWVVIPIVFKLLG